MLSGYHKRCLLTPDVDDAEFRHFLSKGIFNHLDGFFCICLYDGVAVGLKGSELFGILTEVMNI